MENLNKQSKYQLYKDSCKASQLKWREKQQSKEVDEHHKLCKRCSKIQPLTEYGEYKGMVKVEGTNKVQEAMIPYRSCKTCRDRDKMRRW